MNITAKCHVLVIGGSIDFLIGLEGVTARALDPAHHYLVLEDGLKKMCEISNEPWWHVDLNHDPSYGGTLETHGYGFAESWLMLLPGKDSILAAGRSATKSTPRANSLKA